MGSGKSYISKLFENLGAVVYNSDKAAKHIQESNEALKRVLIDKFGDNYYIDGKVNTQYVRSLIFRGTNESYANLKWITETVSKFGREHFINFCNEHKDAPYILAESAILFETGLNKLCDLTINVKCDKAQDAAVLRDNIKPEDWQIRMNTQIPEEQKVFDFVIYNDYTDNVFKQVQEIHIKIINGTGY